MSTSINRQWVEEGVALVTFDRPDSSANIFDRETLKELDGEVSALIANPGLKGVLFTSAKEAIFIAGADIQSLAKGTISRDMLGDYLKLGQETFNLVAAIPVPTIALIHGACVGGGYEFCLACDYRIASDHKVTRIGLPETQLGILPAWGGSTRLPRLIGLPKALDIILGGKVVPARAAKKHGMVDEVVPRELLLRAGLKALKERHGKKSHVSLLHTSPVNKAVGVAVGPHAQKEAMERTHGHYPAVLKALDVVLQNAAERGETAALQRERDAVLELANGEACKNLLHVFLLQERARKLAKQAIVPDPTGTIHTAAVIGAGVMGSGIAQWLSSRGIRVILRDVNAQRVGEGMARIAKLYDEAVKKKVMSAIEARDGMDRISPAPGEVPLHGVQLIVEAAVEKLDIKKQIIAHLDKVAPGNVLFATNTSALPIGEIARATSRPGSLAGVHFFNPVHRMQLVEVVVGADTTAETKSRILRFAHQIGKVPVVVHDRPGFLVNRILLPYLVAAVNAFNAGANIEDIDGAMLAFGMPMGPLRLVDEVGLDIALDVANTLASAFADRMTVPTLLKRMIDAGLLGKKTGRGFYIHSAGKEPQVNHGAEAFRQSDPAVPVPSLEAVESRMVYSMVNEAARCLEDGVVACAEDVDFGMIMGTGFPPFRGGPLTYVNSVGPKRAVQEMETLGITPCSLLYDVAVGQKSIYPQTS